jgi:uncharacterized delta-60 repeat protein
MPIRACRREKLDDKILKTQKKTAMLLSTFIAAASLSFLPTASAADGDLDTTFGTGGIATTHLGSLYDYGESVALQSDGKIVTAGYFYNGTDYDFALVRYNNDGTLDTSFSGDGIVTTDIGNLGDFATSIAIQSDGKIIVAGNSLTSGNYKFALVRYNTDGTLDTSFSGDGKVTTALGVSDDRFYSIGLQSDGKIVAAGSSYDDTGSIFDFALVRYNTDGTSDSSFSGDGKVITAISGLEDSATSVVLQSDGKIVAAGYSYNVDTSIDFTLVRYVASDSAAEAARIAAAAEAARIAAAAEAARIAAAAEAARIAAAAEAAKKAKEQKELTELLSVIPSIAGLALNVGDLANSLLTTKCVKGKVIKYVYKGAKCPKGYVKKK